MGIAQKVGWWDHLGSIPIQAPTPVEVRTFSSDVTDLTLSNTIVKDKHKAPMVGISMEGEASISIQPESTIVPAIIVSSSSTVLEDVGLNVREEMVDVIEATIMEK